MVRLPKNISTNFAFKSDVIKTGHSTLEHELLAEKAHSLGLSANRLLTALIVLNEFNGDAHKRKALVQSAADAAQAFFIQRELMGMMDHRHPIEHFDIPKDVLSRMGAC